MDSEKTKDLVVAVEVMRHLQKEYFRTRADSTLEAAKRSENRVDKLLEEWRNGQRRLFE